MIKLLANRLEIIVITYLTHAWHICVCYIVLCQNASITAQSRLLDDLRAAVCTGRISIVFAACAQLARLDVRAIDVESDNAAEWFEA